MGKYYSDKLEEGIRLIYFQGDASKYPDGMRLIEAACESGEPDAYYFLARMYAWGDGNAKEDDKKALELSLKGILLGSALSVLGVDRMDQLRGEYKAAMTKSLNEYFSEVKQMASEGNPMAQYAVGLFYYWGDIYELLPGKVTPEQVKSCSLESHKWFRMAAAQGCIPAFRNVYVSTLQGQNGIEKNPQAAVAYAEEVKDRIDLTGKWCYDIACEYENQKNYQKALEWTERGISKHDSASMVEMGLFYLEGNPAVTKNEQSALDYFERAISNDRDSFALWNAGRCYFYGLGTPKDERRAFTYFEEAARKGHKLAQKFLAKYYYEGIGGIAADYEKCRYWAEKAAANKCESAKLYLGLCCLYGRGTAQNPQFAIRYFKEAAAASADGEALFCLGEMYDKGLGVAEDIEQAIFYYGQSKTKGYVPAIVRLKSFKQSFFGKWKRV